MNGVFGVWEYNNRGLEWKNFSTTPSAIHTSEKIRNKISFFYKLKVSILFYDLQIPNFNLNLV